MPEAMDPSIREIIYQGYRIIYRLRAGMVEIVMVVQGSRRLAAPGNERQQEKE